MFSIDGNIGSGKSKLLQQFKSTRKEIRGRPLIFVPEPVHLWESIVDGSGVNMIQLFYNDQSKYSFAFQVMAFVSRLGMLEDARRDFPDAILISERCPQTDCVFARMLRDAGTMSAVEYTIYCNLFDRFHKVAPTGIVYVSCDPEIAHARCSARNRLGEESIPLSYLHACHTQHETWMRSTPIPVLHLDNSSGLEFLDAQVTKIVNFIEFIL